MTKSGRHFTSFICLSITLAAAKFVAAEEPSAYEFQSKRTTGQLDHCNVLLEANGDLLVKSSSAEKADRHSVKLTCHRDYDEKTLQLSTSADKALRGVRYYREATADLHKGSVSLNPALQPEHRLVGVEINGAKVTHFCPRSPLSVDELELLSAVGETLPLDQLLPSKPVKVDESWPVSDETLALLLGLEEITVNSVQVTLKAVTPQFGRFELAGNAEGKLYGAANKITLSAKCRFDRTKGRIDWFAMRLDQNREVSVVESGLDWTFLVQMKIAPLESSQELSDAALKNMPLKPNDRLLLVQYKLGDNECQLSHDRNWFLTNHYSDQDEFHRLDHGQDIGMCKVSPQPQISLAKLPSLPQFQGIVQKALGGNFGEVLDVSASENEANLRILRVNIKGSDGGAAMRWRYYHVSDPEGRQVTFSFRVEEKNAEAFGDADQALVQSVRFLEKVEKVEKK